MLRLFIAIELPGALRTKALKSIEHIRHELGRRVHWVPEDNMHLTLRFLGNVAEERIGALRGVMDMACSGRSAFELGLGSLGCFPLKGRPRVLWLGVEVSRDLKQLQSGIEIAVAAAGFPHDNQVFSPHLTLGRVREGLSHQDFQLITNSISTRSLAPLGLFRVEAVHLIRSELHPSVARYSMVYSTALAGQTGGQTEH